MPKQVYATNIATFSSNPFILLYRHNPSFPPLRFDCEKLNPTPESIWNLCVEPIGGAANWHCTDGQRLVHEPSETVAALA